MPIPGNLKYAGYDRSLGIPLGPDYPFGENEAAVDPAPSGRQIVLAKPPSETLPGGGVLTSYEIEERIFGRATDDTLVQLIKESLLGCGDGIKETVIRDDSIPTADAAQTRADGELPRLSKLPVELKYAMFLGPWEIGEKIDFEETEVGVEIELLVLDYDLEIVPGGKPGKDEIWSITFGPRPDDDLPTLLAESIARSRFPISRPDVRVIAEEQS